MIPVYILGRLQGLNSTIVITISFSVLFTHVLYDADQADVSPRHGVVLVCAQDVGPGHDDGQVVVMREAPCGGGHLQHCVITIISFS